MTRNSEIEKIVNEQLRPIDDVMFVKMAEDKDFLEELLQVILDDSSLTVLEHETQKELSNLAGRSARIDTLCRLSNQKLVNVEVQKANKTDHQKRVRYHASLITANNTKPNTDFGDIPDVCIVYIAEFDIFGAGKALYEVKRVVNQTGIIVENGLTELYVNAKSCDDTRIAKLMKVLATTDIYDNEFPKTSDRKHLLLQGTKEKENMNAAIQKLIDEAVNEKNAAMQKLIDEAVDEKQKTITALSDQNTALSDQNTALSKQNTDLINEIEMLKVELAKIKKNINN